MTRWARETRNSFAMVPAGLIALVLVLAVAVSVLLCALAVGLPLLDRTLRAIRNRANQRRSRLVGVPAPYPALPGGVTGRLRVLAGDAAIWRDMTWLLAYGIVGLPAALIVIGLWVYAAAGVTAPVLLLLRPAGEVLQLNGQQVTDAATAWLVVGQALLAGALAYFLQRWLSSAERGFARALLRPTARAVLAGRIVELNENRADALDSWEAELRRIERDLHDGTQAQLTALTMNLGLAEQLAGADEPVRQLVAEARASARTALEGLRDIVQGIHPPVLAERGLTGGLEELALAAAVPVRLSADLPQRLAPALESALYFTAAELITNAARHSGCDRVDVVVTRSADRIRLTVRDNGAGGTVPRAGGGLQGLHRRLTVLGGELVTDSPPGGPTVITAVVPCGS